jgi:hypothetical protein
MEELPAASASRLITAYLQNSLLRPPGRPAASNCGNHRCSTIISYPFFYPAPGQREHRSSVPRTRCGVAVKNLTFYSGNCPSVVSGLALDLRRRKVTRPGPLTGKGFSNNRPPIPTDAFARLFPPTKLYSTRHRTIRCDDRSGKAWTIPANLPRSLVAHLPPAENFCQI